ncbi:MAG: hypothetical protein KKH98_03555 [Spirochaetes bacterium]|nr:hypothetical protein [Spirochaetota bacterium]
MKNDDLLRLQQLERMWHDHENFSAQETHEFVRLFKERVQEFISGKA